MRLYIIVEDVNTVSRELNPVVVTARGLATIYLLLEEEVELENNIDSLLIPIYLGYNYLALI